jgi:hypothetical protein
MKARITLAAYFKIKKYPGHHVFICAAVILGVLDALGKSNLGFGLRHR